MHPILFRIPLPGGGYFDIATYGVMMALGTIFGALVAVRLGKRDGVPRDTVIDIAFWAVLCGIAGAKLWFIVQFWDAFPDKRDLFANFRSGLVYYGGLVGGTIGVLIYARIKRISLMKTLDVVAPGGILGLAFGRIGCFLNGCCYGKAVAGLPAVCFAKVVEDGRIIGSPAFLDQLDKGLVTAADAAAKPVFPSQLLASADALIVFAALLLLRRTRKFYGEQIALLFCLYAVVRFGEEFLRGDNDAVLFSLTMAQVTSVLMFAAGAGLFAWLRKRRPASLALAGPALPSQSAGQKARPNKGL